MENKILKTKRINMKKGFTLSEVLITLGIVGVISALTIPAVMKDYKQRLYVSQLKKAYSQLADTTQSIMSDEHSSSFYTTNGGVPDGCEGSECTKGPAYMLNNYFKTMKKNCGTGKDGACVATGYQAPDGTATGDIPEDYYCIQTTNSSTICGKYDAADGELGTTKFIIDVNGLSEPNITGRDVFVVKVNPDGLIADINEDETKCNQATGGDGPINYASGCLARIMSDNWQMKY